MDRNLVLGLDIWRSPMASRHEISSSSSLHNSAVNLPLPGNRCLTSSIVTTILFVADSEYLWKGNLSELKRFVGEHLKLMGKWTSPGGEVQLFTSTEFSQKLFGPKRKRFMITSDNKDEFMANTLWTWPLIVKMITYYRPPSNIDGAWLMVEATLLRRPLWAPFPCPLVSDTVLLLCATYRLIQGVFRRPEATIWLIKLTKINRISIQSGSPLIIIPPLESCKQQRLIQQLTFLDETQTVKLPLETQLKLI